MQGTHESTMIVETEYLPYSALLEKGKLKDFEDNTFDQNGISLTLRTNYIIIDAEGRRIHPPSYFTALSWTGIPTPCDRQAYCANPWDMHSRRIIFDGQDGALMPNSMIFLCNECIGYNNNLIKNSKKFWIFYKPITY